MLRSFQTKPESANYTVDQTAHRFGVSSATIWRLLRDGELARVKIGRRTFVRRVDAERFLASRVETAA